MGSLSNVNSFNYDPKAQYLFKRAYALAIGRPKQTAAVQFANFAVPGDGQLQPAAALRVRFEIEKNMAGTSNKGKIEIFNMSQTTRQSIGKGSVVRLQAGYNGLLETLFTGVVCSNGFKTVRSGADIITSLECGDGESSIKMTSLHKTYPPGTFLAQVIRDIALAMNTVTDEDPVGVNAGAILAVPEFTYGRGLAISGPCEKTLNKILKNFGLRWFVDNGNLNIVPVNSTVGQNGILVTAGAGPNGFFDPTFGSGLIGTPSQNGQLLVFTSLLNPKLVPGAKVQFVSENTALNGYYQVKTAKYEGDSHDSKWQVTCECTLLQKALATPAASNGFNIGTVVA